MKAAVNTDAASRNKVETTHESNFGHSAIAPTLPACRYQTPARRLSMIGVRAGCAANALLVAGACASGPHVGFDETLPDSPDAAVEVGGFAQSDAGPNDVQSTACARAAAEKSSTGCEYYAVYPYYVNAGSSVRDLCYVVFVANSGGIAISSTF